MSSARKPPLHPTTLRTLRMLRAGARLSRNRHFSFFEDPRARRGLRLHRYLSSIVKDVERYSDTMSVAYVDGRYALRIDFPMLQGHRTAYLSGFELELLADQAPQVAELLAELAATAADGEHTEEPTVGVDVGANVGD